MTRVHEVKPSEPTCRNCDHPMHEKRCNHPSGHLGVVMCYCRKPEVKP